MQHALSRSLEKDTQSSTSFGSSLSSGGFFRKRSKTFSVDNEDGEKVLVSK